MPSKSKAPALDRLVRREWKRMHQAFGCSTSARAISRQALTEYTKRVAAECARIAKSCPTGIGAESAIYEQFRIEEGEDA